jgi:RNA polymerase sigma factor (sigma-70 family)
MVASLSDARLVARCREGDEAAWNELVTRFSRYVYAIIGQGFGLRAENAEDVFQEVFARAYQHLGRLREDEAIRPWLAQLTRRLCIDQLRSGSREQLSDEELEPSDVDETLDTLVEALAVTRATRRSAPLSTFPPARSPAGSRAVSQSSASCSREEIRPPTRPESNDPERPLRRRAPRRAPEGASSCA